MESNKEKDIFIVVFFSCRIWSTFKMTGYILYIVFCYTCFVKYTISFSPSYIWIESIHMFWKLIMCNYQLGFPMEKNMVIRLIMYIKHIMMMFDLCTSCISKTIWYFLGGKKVYGYISYHRNVEFPKFSIISHFNNDHQNLKEEKKHGCKVPVQCFKFLVEGVSVALCDIPQWNFLVYILYKTIGQNE